MAIGNPINLTSNVEGKNISVIATAGQTQFTVTGGYRINQISVFRNGVRLVDGRDFTALDGSIVTLLSAATVADVIEFQVFDDFRVSDALNVNSGGTVNGNVTVTGILSTTNLSIGSSISLDATSGIVTAVQFIGQMTGTASTATEAEGLTGVPDITVNNIVAAAATFSGVVTYEDVTNIDSLGIVTARTGVDITANGLVVNAGVSTFAADLSIADKIVHTGDANTAIRFPSNDTFTVETSGVQRLEVNSTGNVGLVGIATATGLVVVAGSGVYAGHTGIITAVTFDGALSGAATQVTVADESSDTTCFPLFATAATGDLAPKSGTNLTFNSSSGALTATSFVGAVTGDVTGSISGGTVAGSTGTFSGDVSIADKIVHTGDTNTALKFPAADTFTVETDGSERFRISSAGLVGIGTDDPDNFNVSADDLVIFGTGHQGITIRSGTAHDGSIMFNDTNDANQRGIIRYIHTDDAMAFHTSGGEALRITSAGLVGIGTNIPENGLHVSDGSSFAAPQNTGAGRIMIEHATSSDLQFMTSNSGYSHIFFGDQDDANVGVINYVHNSGVNAMTFATNAAERLRIDSLGNIGVNQTSVNSSRKMEITQPSSYTSGLRINSAGSSGNGAYFEVFVGSANYTFGGNHATDAFLIRRDGTEKLRVNSTGVSVTGSATISGDIDLTDSTVDLYSQTTNGASKTFQLFSDIGGTKTEKVFIEASGDASFAGTVSDSKGELRTIPQNSKSTAYTLVAADAGKHVLNTADVTVPASVFAAGNAITIINGSGSNINITQGSGATIYYTADGTSGSRVLAARGMASMLFVNSTDCYISGAGLS